jgi:hypothetical protein
VFKLWFVAFMALISWGAALILRPLVQRSRGKTLGPPWQPELADLDSRLPSSVPRKRCLD